MKAKLSAGEAQELSKYRFAIVRPTGIGHHPLSDFMQGPWLAMYLEGLAGKLAAPDVKTAASILMKRFAFLAVIHLYAMTVFDKRLDSKPGNIIVLDMYKEGLWLPEFRFTSWETVASRAGMRDGWKEDSIRYLFADNLSPLIDGLVKETKIPKLILWENIAIYIYWLYEKVLPGIAEERAAADFAYLLHSAPGNLFGDDHQSPLKKYYSETGMKALERPRRTCCFSYKVKGGDYCKICPVVCN